MLTRHHSSQLSVIDGICMIVGLVVGAGIFRAPSSVAGQTIGPGAMMGAWLLGGVIAACGAICYALLARMYPDSGGEYTYLRASYPVPVSFLFVWARIAVLQTGSIAATAYIFGDYASNMLSLGPYSPVLYAFAAVAGLTLINILGLQLGKWTQNILTVVKVLGLVLIVGAALLVERAAASTPAAEASAVPAFGLAMVFVLYTYGGWNEAAYLAGDVRKGPAGLAAVLAVSIGIITLIYLAVNAAYVRVLGFEGLQASTAPASDVMAAAMGTLGSVFVSVLTAIAALGTTNATIFTGSRAIHALGANHPSLRRLGTHHVRWGTPTTAFALQGAVALSLVLVSGMLGEKGRHGFEVAVEYTAPAFWTFILLVALVAVSKAIHTVRRRILALPLLVASLIFLGMCGYMLYSSLAYTGIGALLGAGIVVLGAPVYFLVRSRDAKHA